MSSGSIARDAGIYLAIDEAEIEVEPKRQNLTELRLTVSALAINEQATIAEAKK